MSHLPVVLGILATILILAGAISTTQFSVGAYWSNYLLGAGVVTFLAGVLVFVLSEEDNYAEQ